MYRMGFSESCGLMPRKMQNIFMRLLKRDEADNVLPFFALPLSCLDKQSECLTADM
jgi:hypothetical protein